MGNSIKDKNWSRKPSEIYGEHKNHQKILWPDKGKEFYNKSMKELLEKNNVELYSTETGEKSSIVERWNRTIKRNVWKYFSANNTMKYIDILPNLIKKYNNTYHRSIKCTPALARAPLSYQHVHDALYNRPGEDNDLEVKLEIVYVF